MVFNPRQSLFNPDSPYAVRTNKLCYAVFVPLGFVLVYLAVLSLRWRTVHDLPILLYLGFLMENYGYVPYRDFLDVNLPGMHLLSQALWPMVGHGDLALRIFDLGYLGTILTVTWFYLKRLSWRAAWGGSILFGVSYLLYGPNMSLQREYLLILPLALIVLIASRSRPKNLRLTAVLIGLLFGLCATIKLHAVIGFPLLLWFLIREQKDTSRDDRQSTYRTRQIIGLAAGGLAVPLAAILAYLWYHGALTPFWDFVTNYWPLYAELGKDHRVLSGASRIWYLLEHYTYLGTHTLWMTPAAVGTFVAIHHARFNSTQKRRVILLAGMALIYSVYPLATGQFWSYHWLIFQYFMVVVSALCLVGLSPDIRRGWRWFPTALLMFVIFLRIVVSVPFHLQKQYQYELPKGGRVIEIADFLQRNLRPGDTVQPMDWTGGAIHAMLIAKAQIATRFIYAFSFYHHISQPYIQDLRQEFMAELNFEKPRFIIMMGGGFPWVHGPDTTDEFAELSSFLGRYYGVAWEGRDFKIYERVR